MYTSTWPLTAPRARLRRCRRDSVVDTWITLCKSPDTTGTLDLASSAIGFAALTSARRTVDLAIRFGNSRSAASNSLAPCNSARNILCPTIAFYAIVAGGPATSPQPSAARRHTAHQQSPL